MIRKGDQVFIKPEWQDKGDDQFTWVALEDSIEGFSLRIQALDSRIGMTFPPVHTVQLHMLIHKETQA